MIIPIYTPISGAGVGANIFLSMLIVFNFCLIIWLIIDFIINGKRKKIKNYFLDNDLDYFGSLVRTGMFCFVNSIAIIIYLVGIVSAFL